MPETIPDDRWPELINSPLLEARKSLYRYDTATYLTEVNSSLSLRYLFLRELYRKRRTATVEQNNDRRVAAAHRRAQLLADGQQPTNYPGYTSIFRHLGRQSEKYFREQLLLAPARLGEMIVIDCGFEQEHARKHHLLNLVDQVQYLFADIQRYHSPSFLYLCNLAADGRLRAEFDRRSSMDSFCFEATESSYLDVFPQEKLIYLSPDSQNEMTEFDHDAVYIIGGIIDVSKYSFPTGTDEHLPNALYLLLAGKKPLTFGKAKRDNVRHQRFPIDRYVK